jgi:hypothetical protein
MGRIAGGWTRSLKVRTQIKVMAGAVWIGDPSMYPAAPATMHPTIKPTIILAFFMNGEPNNSTS